MDLGRIVPSDLESIREPVFKELAARLVILTQGFVREGEIELSDKECWYAQNLNARIRDVAAVNGDPAAITHHMRITIDVILAIAGTGDSLLKRGLEVSLSGPRTLRLAKINGSRTS